MTEIAMARVVDGKKFLWDGEQYESEDAAKAAAEGYREQGFEVHEVSDGARVLIYTRRLATKAEES